MIKPTGKNVLVERIPASKETASGIILKSTDESDKAKILAIGSEVREVTIDELAVVNWNQATKVEDETYIISEDEIIFTIAG